MSCLVSASLLGADLSRLGEETQSIAQAGADWIHFDVMDGHFVPNLSFGLPVLSKLRPSTDKIFDVHLMIQNAELMLESYIKEGADIITIHVEAVTHLQRALSQIRSLGAKAGVALNPATNEKILDYILDDLDLVLVMGVNPGFGAQSYLDSQTKKIARIKDKIAGRKIHLSVDGGVNVANNNRIKSAGADVLVAGSYLFSSASQQVRSQRIGILRGS